MGDIKGFKKYARSLPPNERPEERIDHFEEFQKKSVAQQISNQSARCMDCGVPFCHSACPLGNLIPEFNDAVYRDDWKLAYEILKETNNFPEFTGRICPAPCEASCVLGINSEAVTIEYIEKAVIEKAFDESYVTANQSIIRTGFKVGIVGSGPAGLACADQLNKLGHNITVFEKNDQVGGLLRYGIPDFKLEKRIIDRRLSILEKEGIEFTTTCHIGVDKDPKELLAEFDAVVLCGGSEHPRNLTIPGREFEGIHFAMDFLTQSNRYVAGKVEKEDFTIQVENKHVIVIGGGDTGSDCIGNSTRLGAKDILQIELMGKPANSRGTQDMWPLWPMTLKTSSSHEEAGDREWALQTKRFLSEDGHQLSGIEVVDVHWKKDKQGQYRMQEVDGTSRVLKADIVFLALGFLHPTKEGLLEKLNVDLDARGNVSTMDYLTSQDKVFSAGDMRRGQSLVVWAIAEGRSCAEKVDDFLKYPAS